jgi:multicomponent Na+:H+ antiporter subunit B
VSPRVRRTVFLPAAAVFAVFFVLTCTELPHFGTADHPYGARAVAAAVRRHTANVGSSVNFDQRALYTRGV